MPDIQARHTAKSQMGFQDPGSPSYTTGAGDISFAVSLTIFQRIALWDIPQGSTINSATLTWNLAVKNAGTTQNSSLRTQAHASGDSPILKPGQNERSARGVTSATTDWTASWNGAASGDQYSVIDVRAIMQELVNRSDWTPASYVTFITTVLNENGSDMSVRANNDFVLYPRIDMVHTPPVRDEQFIVNRCENSEFGTEVLAVDPGTTSTVPFWFQGNFFGGWVDTANQGTIVRDTSFTRRTGVPTMKFTTGTPQADAPQKRTGPTLSARWRDKEPFTFSGWVYVPSTIPLGSDFRAGDPYRGGGVVITDRDKWVPFCCSPTWDAGDEDGWTARYPAIGITYFQPGWQFWISEPCFTSLPFKHMPFNGTTPDVKDPGNVTLIDNRSTASQMQSYRLWTPRTSVVRGGVPKRVARWTKRPDGLLEQAEPIKGGPLVPNLPAIAIGGYPADQTVAEL